MSESPDLLPIDDIHIASALFQPREMSLLLAPFKSDQHVKTLVAAVNRGSVLEPVSVVSFGDKWFLIDGHHRLQAYLKAKYADPVPVTAHVNESRGNERLIWAQTLSTELNSRDKLPMSPADKMDSAWRLCVEGGQTKEHIACTAGCSTSAVGNMRRVAKQLRDGGRFQDSDLVAFNWRRAYTKSLRR